MPPLPNAQLAHFGFHVRDLDAMIAFYEKALGLVVTDVGDYYMGGRIAFLSRDPAEHHQIVLASGRADDGSMKLINQISFKVASLEDLKAYYDWLVPLRVDDMKPRNHGNAWSIYFRDPEGNRIEIYTPTPWYVGQPFGDALDLTLTADDIRALTDARVKADASAMPIAQWSAQLQARIARGGAAP
ncbi:MAG: hypothetical protein JWN93_1579 [Hyphomicrobiales bacterium]|nr:hypothetical protein [Hyphomicrobiales bacterium]